MSRCLILHVKLAWLAASITIAANGPHTRQAAASGPDAFPQSTAPSLPYPSLRVPPVAPTEVTELPDSSILPPPAVAPSQTVGQSVPTHVPAPTDAWFYQPGYWWGSPWKGSVELGINGTSGNSDAFNMRIGGSLKRETATHILSLDATHAKNEANSIATANNALGKAKIERLLGESPWSLFVSGTAEYDEFKDFDLRLAANAGVGYRFIKNDATTLATRFGSGVSHEIGGVDDRYVPEALFALDFEHCFSKKQKIKICSEYLPEWGDFENYRLVSDASYEILLDEIHNLSLKLGAIDRYDSTPNGREANDIDYLLLLLWKI